MSISATELESAAQPANPRSRVIMASLIGTTIEFYDFYAYATAAALIFPGLFFPTADATTSLLASFATFGAAMVARPIGAIVFGHFGDRFGRKATLVGSLLVMGIATFLIGLLPTYQDIGWWAALLLLVLRLAQGFALGGEWSGAALVATENAPRGKRAWYGTFPQLGAPLGFLISNGLFLVISLALPNAAAPGQPSAAFLGWGWRIPFLFSIVMVAVGLWVRLRLVESTAFQRTVRRGAVRRLPLATVFRSNWRQLILGTAFMLATYVLFYLLTSFVLSFGTKASSLEAASAAAAKAAQTAGKPFDPAAFAAQFYPGLGYGYNTFILMLMAGVVFFGVFTLVSGPLADRFGRRRTLLWVTAAIIVFGLLFAPLLGGGTAWVMVFLIVGFTLMGLTFGPMGALLPELFPTNVRYTGSAFSYNVSSILGAAVAPLIAVWLWQSAAGSPVLVGVYLSVMALITLVALFVSRETKDVDIDA